MSKAKMEDGWSTGKKVAVGVGFVAGGFLAPWAVSVFVPGVGWGVMLTTLAIYAYWGGDPTLAATLPKGARAMDDLIMLGGGLFGAKLAANAYDDYNKVEKVVGKVVEKVSGEVHDHTE